MFFFFQAEDGIRDLTVTGVQTCALPISLADLNERSAVAPIEGLLLNDPDPEVRRECASALGNLSLARALEPLARALGDEDVDVRRQAASAIADLDDVTKAPTALIRATTSPD